MKKILVFGMTDNPGGMESCIMNYYRNMPSEEIQFDFLTNYYPMIYADEVTKNGSKVFYIPKKSEKLKDYYKALGDFFKKHGKEYDAIWYNTCTLSNIDYLVFAKRYGIKKRIIHAHNVANEAGKVTGILHNIHKHFLTLYATDYYACTLDAAKYFYKKKTIDSSSFKLVKNAIQTDKFIFDETKRNSLRDKYGVDGKYVIGHVGRFQRQKNHTFMIDIFKEYKAINKDAVLFLVGQGYLEADIRKKVEDYGLKDSVIFAGVTKDVSSMLNLMDCFLFPSLFEGLGIVALEAQANGLPVVASKDVIPSEVKVLDNLKFVGLDRTPQEWAKAIDEVKNNTYRGRTDDIIKAFDKSGYNIENEALKMYKIMLKEN